MSYLDNLESSLKNLETNQERGADVQRDAQHRASEKARALAAAPYADALKNGSFTHDFLAHATRIGFTQRMKVQPIWLGSTLRLQARERRLELRPTPDGVRAHYFEDDQETGSEIVDLQGNAEELARRWLAA
ncbi:MAG TPA: hypothetical protein VER03_00685 [Bryobacteraceae bacterium]|nr:hypothetical protein [Bryobacteraceae bacterium]